VVLLADGSPAGAAATGFAVIRMPYYTKVLQPGENVKYLGRLHWTIYIRALLYLIFMEVLAFGSISLLDLFGHTLLIIAFFTATGLIQFFNPWLRRATTEIVVTDKRIIHKVGLIARQTEEMNISKIETVDVSQGVWGRIFDYGTVLIIGVGASWEPLEFVASPLELRNAILVG
jgi:uncharacterized membrane protein YdbT with pleckstrin-like domain